MTDWKALGEFEHLLLLATMRLADDAYGVTLRQEIEERTGRPVSLGSIYPTMHRLEVGGFVTSLMSDPVPTRGGRSRRFYRLTPEGLAIVVRAREMISAMWDGHEGVGAG